MLNLSTIEIGIVNAAIKRMAEELQVGHSRGELSQVIAVQHKVEEELRSLQSLDRRLSEDERSLVIASTGVTSQAAPRVVVIFHDKDMDAVKGLSEKLCGEGYDARIMLATLCDFVVPEVQEPEPLRGISRERRLP